MNPRDRDNKEIYPGCKIMLDDNSPGYGATGYPIGTIFTYTHPTVPVDPSGDLRNITIRVKEDEKIIAFSRRFVVLSLRNICNSGRNKK